ncbi:basic helix-loop-helix (bHLH) DNA-binding superfamily protein [Rhynchospora pubera]|uniref:Basic helix-loop-helix (BHLH) DNA-binding superfamily protein n=1 Tax=Rhynchospora pubera TaxID=906938 RepID=A0AAV8HCL6_9POAL|nr:basic helix-loop-helix (bHLH) DNA-binding superfamily protein [Rhynchospora pubera]
MDDKGVVQGEGSYSYLEMLKRGMEEGNEEEILGFSSRFLGFGGFYEPLGLPPIYQEGVTGTGTGSGITVQQMSSESSSVSSLSSSPTSTAATNSVLTNSSSSKQPKKKQANGGRKTEATSVGNNKKAKIGGGVSPGGTIKVRKEKLGERIMALQQLVSPFGKSDTASVLHEALGYIRFLHDQVQVLSSPYLQRLPSSTTLHEGSGVRSDLRSRGLCLVPVSCTEHVANGNGADLWSPSVGKHNPSSFSSDH